jgi:hypothetical protein
MAGAGARSGSAAMSGPTGTDPEEGSLSGLLSGLKYVFT